ncbi:hypothetical protein [Trichococcus shcherbakoviae]|uniref:hypothetical protein n=1 Tax=Trichococcus shcherbakoviae TaxID=2094020 RepID=UPI002AA8086C|nr:hypothetical protein [Trichococcus shcherbakoviae]
MLYESNGPITRVSVDASDEATLKAAATGFRQRILAASLVAGAAGATFTVKSASTGIVGTIILAANGHWLLPASGIGYCETDAGEALILDVTAGAVGGVVTVQTIK